MNEVRTSVVEVFAGSTLPGLTSPKAIVEALGRLRNVLAELAGLYHVVATAKPGQALTLVHDYEGVGAWMEGRWRTMRHGPWGPCHLGLGRLWLRAGDRERAHADLTVADDALRGMAMRSWLVEVEAALSAACEAPG